MRKALIVLMSTSAIGAATIVGAVPAAANPALVAIPWLFVAGAGGLAAGAVAENSQPKTTVVETAPAYPPDAPIVYAAPPPAAPVVYAALPPGAYYDASGRVCSTTNHYTRHSSRSVTVCN